MRKNWIADAALGEPLRILFVAIVLLAAVFPGPDAVGATAGTCSAPDIIGQVTTDGGGCWLAEGPPVPGPGRTLAASAVASEAPVVPGAPVIPGAPVVPVVPLVPSESATSPSGSPRSAPGGVLFTELLGGGVAALVAAIAVVGLWSRPTRARRLTSR